MKRFVVLAVMALIIPSLASAADDLANWRVWSRVQPGSQNGQVMLVIAGTPVASGQLSSRTTLRGRYQGHDVTVRCNRPSKKAASVACDVVADGKVLKRLYFNSAR